MGRMAHPIPVQGRMGGPPLRCRKGVQAQKGLVGGDTDKAVAEDCGVRLVQGLTEITVQPLPAR